MAYAAPVKVLFVCSHNKWRSTTGEAVFSRVEGVSARWADLILVMEDEHAARLRDDFRQDVAGKTLHVLDIPDDYQFMDEELVELIRAKAEPLIFTDG